jgi:hypothetical protein
MGFEGLLCDLLSTLTGRRFFLAAAGSQHGRDLSTGGLGGTWIAVEAKRFLESTALKERELLSEISQLSLQTPRPDLWILIVSRSVPEQLVAKLHQAGLNAGVEIDIVDAPTDNPGDLDVLCVSDPETTIRYLSEAVLPNLQALRERPGFTERIESLRQRFCAPALGFDHVRHRAQTWFQEALGAPEEARARLGGQPLALLSPTTHFVRRRGAETALEAWWQAWRQDPRPFVLVGEEGVGKTWAAAGWAASQAASAPGTILLFVTTRDIDTAEPEELIRSCLCEVTDYNYEAVRFWQSRLGSWLSRPSGAAPLFLLVLDGINERSFFEWRDLFDRLNGAPWRERVAVLVTCRPGYWDESRFMPAQKPREWTLTAFDDEELDEALQANGRCRSDFASDLFPLLRKPRYLALALKHYDRLEETGDFTIDRLFYEDWKDRLERKRSLKMTDGEFRRLLGDLARHYKEGRVRFSHRELEELLPSDAATDLMELLTGGLLTIDRGLAQLYKVESGWLIHGLGLLLAAQLNERAGGTDSKEELARFLEPHLEVDQQGDILAAASLFALFTPDYSQEARQALLYAWVSRQNHSRTSVNRLQAYVPIAVEDYLSLLETLTLNRHLDNRAIERIEYALLSWRFLPKVESALVERATRWLSLTHPEGFPYMRPPKTGGRQGSLEKRTASNKLCSQIENRAGSPLTPGRSLRLSRDYRLEVTSSDGFTWLADSALFFLSALPETHRLVALRQWALSRAVIGAPREWSQVAWLLRQAATREFEDALLGIVEPLLDHPLPAARKAGGELLDCLGTPRASERRATLPKEIQGIVPEEDDHKDSCMRRLWRREECAECLKREDLTDLFVARKLSALALDPSFELPEAAFPRIRRALDTIDFSEVWGRFERTVEEGYLEGIEPAVAVAHPQCLIATYRSVVRIQSRDEEGWKALSFSLEKVHPLLNRQQELAALKKRWHALCQLSPGKNDQLVDWECDLFAAMIANQPAIDQLQALLSRPLWAFDNLDLLGVFQDMDEPSLTALLESLPGYDNEVLERRLVFLLAQSKLNLTPRSENFLCRLLKLPESAPRKPPSRCLALQVILRFGNARVLEKAILGGELLPGDVVFFHKRWPGEGCLLSLRTRLDYATLRKSVDLATLGYILVASERLDDDLASYTDDLDTTLRQEKLEPSDPFHPCFPLAFSVPIMRTVLKRKPLVVTGWLELAIKDDLDWSHINFMKSTYPMYEAVCEALFLERDSRARGVYAALRYSTRQKESFFRDKIGDTLPLLLFRVNFDEVRSDRKAWYEACWGDMALLDFATAARQHGREDFLLALIHDGLASPAFFDQAKAISLAGWCGAAPGLRTLLENLPVLPGSWFESLKGQTLSRIRREDWARSWFWEFLSARSLAKSFAAFRLFLRCVDRRYYAWRAEVVQGVPEATVPWQGRLKFLAINYREIEKAIEDYEKDLDKYFLYLSIPRERLSPWTDIPLAREDVRRRQIPGV